jgi:hypothetical protein
MQILVVTDREVLVIDAMRGTSAPARGISDGPTCLAADRLVQGRTWCGTHRGGVFRSDDGGSSWEPIGLAGRLIMAVAASPSAQGVVWAGTEPSEVWRSGNAGNTWERTSDLTTLHSSSEWSFPPRPETHHVRWIACHPLEPERLWVAIEAGALISTIDGGRTAFRVDPGTPTNSPFIARLPTRCACPLATGITRVTTPALLGTRPAPVSRSATCAAWRLTVIGQTSSSYQHRLGHTPRTSLVARMAGCTAVWIASAGSGCATAGRSQPARSRHCSMPARRLGSCGPWMNAVCIARMTAERVGGAWPVIQRRRSTCGDSR